MARGYYRTDKTVCLYCGYTELDQEGKRKEMPYKYGNGANKTYLCEKCYNRSTRKEL